MADAICTWCGRWVKRGTVASLQARAKNTKRAVCRYCRSTEEREKKRTKEQERTGETGA